MGYLAQGRHTKEHAYIKTQQIGKRKKIDKINHTHKYTFKGTVTHLASKKRRDDEATQLLISG